MSDLLVTDVLRRRFDRILVDHGLPPLYFTTEVPTMKAILYPGSRAQTGAAAVGEPLTCDPGYDTVLVTVRAGQGGAMLEACGAGHVVIISEHGVVVEHPLAERIDGTMVDCTLLSAAKERWREDPGPAGYGRYSAIARGEGANLRWAIAVEPDA